MRPMKTLDQCNVGPCQRSTNQLGWHEDTGLLLECATWLTYRSSWPTKLVARASKLVQCLISATIACRTQLSANTVVGQPLGHELASQFTRANVHVCGILASGPQAV